MVTDFGIARAGVSEITQTGSVMGTPHYLSPEQAQGEEVTPVSDLYSIGVILYEALDRPRPLRRRKRRRGGDETGLPDAAAAELDQPAGLTGARRGRDAGAGEGPGRALPERRRLHRRPRRGAEGAGDELAGGTAAFAPLPPAVVGRDAEVAEMDELEEEERARRRRRWIAGGDRGAPDRRSCIGFALTRDTTTEVPNVTGNRSSVAIAAARAERLLGRRNQAGRSAKRRRTPCSSRTRSPRPRPTNDCSFLSLLLLEAEGRPDGQRRARAAPRCPATAGLPPGRGDRKAGRGRLRGRRSKRANSDRGRRRAGDPLRPAGRHDRDRRLDRRHSPSPRGPKLAKVPVLVGTQRSVAVQQIRGRGLAPSVTEEESSAAGGPGDPPVAERRQPGRARARPSRSSSPRAKKRRRCRT